LQKCAVWEYQEATLFTVLRATALTRQQTLEGNTNAARYTTEVVLLPKHMFKQKKIHSDISKRQDIHDHSSYQRNVVLGVGRD
jgi:hypothetical protein